MGLFHGQLNFFSGPPDVPAMVVVDVRGISHVAVRFQPPESQETGLCTRFKGKAQFQT